MTMQGDLLKQLRKHAGMTQGAAADALGISTAYYGELERDEKPIDARMHQRVTEALRTRIDVGFSRALDGWTVTIHKPIHQGGHRAGARHEVLARKDTEQEAMALADETKADREPFARILVHRRPETLSTTNSSGV